MEATTIGIDRYIWPLELPDRKLWPAVERACHALSLDDERTTFHPVLWDEDSVAEGKISQVWFSGMHANVGGGYPDDSLAGVPLLWIIRQAQAAGLQFKVSPQQPDALLVAQSTRDKDGRLYDSRAGLGSYYRYGPRDVEALCSDDQNGVKITLPKIHESVFARMASKATAYAPIGIPKSYVVAKEDGTIAARGSPGVETIGQAETRYELQQLAWNVVWWKRLVYFLTVAASLHLALFPLFHAINPTEEYTTALRFISETVRIAGAFLPDFVTTWWLDSFATNPLTFLISILAVAVLTIFGLRLGVIVEDRMLAAWQRQTPPRNRLQQATDSFVQWLRTARWYRALIKFLKYKIAPPLFALATIAIVFAFVSHLAFYFEDAAGLTCTLSPNATILGDGQTSTKLTFSSDSLCWATGIKLTAGKRYIIKVENPKGWQDNDYAADLGGYDIRSLPSLWDRTKMVLATPLRRILLRPWFRVIARVGEKGTDEYFLDPDANSGVVRQLDVPFYPHRSGELYLYVNDAVLPIFMDTFYLNNKGTATVTVTQKGPAAH